MITPLYDILITARNGGWIATITVNGIVRCVVPPCESPRAAYDIAFDLTLDCYC